MRKLLIPMIISLLALVTPPTALAEAVPKYAKWGKIALVETQKRYDADIVDYKHIGRFDLTSEKSEEKFKFWLRSKAGNEFGVNVIIQFDPSTEKILSIIFQKAAK